jgi:hypothetical protein
VEALESRTLCGPQHSRDLDVERVAGRRRLAGIELEVLGDRLDLVAERLQQRPVRQIDRQHDSR